MQYQSQDTNQDRNKGLIVTIIVHALLMLAVFLFGFRYMDPPPPGGMIVAYGTDMDGFGSPAYNEIIPPEPPKPKLQQQEVSEESLLTQDNDSPVEIKKVTKTTKKPTEKPVDTPEKPKEDPKPSSKVTSALANVINAGSDLSKGDGQGQGYKGSPDGSIHSDNYGVAGMGGDGNYRLAGRGDAIVKPQPEYTGKDQGRVTVRIQVDREGNVISAKYILQGTEVTDPILIRNAEKAARATKWKANPNAEPIQEGTIIYNFRLRG